VDTLQVLKEAKKLIEKGRCQDQYWRDADGCGCSEKEAESCCLIGAIEKAAYGIAATQASGSITATHVDTLCRPAISAVARVTSSNVTHWNDAPDRTKEQVLSALDRAMLNLEKETTNESND
jgi:hypothetical protein